MFILFYIDFKCSLKNYFFIYFFLIFFFQDEYSDNKTLHSPPVSSTTTATTETRETTKTTETTLKRKKSFSPTREGKLPRISSSTHKSRQSPDDSSGSDGSDSDGSSSSGESGGDDSGGDDSGGDGDLLSGNIGGVNVEKARGAPKEQLPRKQQLLFAVNWVRNHIVSSKEKKMTFTAILIAYNSFCRENEEIPLNSKHFHQIIFSSNEMMSRWRGNESKIISPSQSSSARNDASPLSQQNGLKYLFECDLI